MKKLTYYIREKELEGKHYDIVSFLEDVSGSENFFIKWGNSQDKTTGTNISKIKKLSNDMIEISFPILCDDDIDSNPYVISKERFIKFLEDWRDFGKSKKKYIYLKEDNDGWYSFEYPEEKDS